MSAVVERLVRVVGTASFLEGPAADARGRVFVSDILANRLLCWADGRFSVFREDAGRANGNVLTAQGWLYTAEGGEMGPGGRRRITRTHVDSGRYEVLTEEYDGQRYNSPNDLCVAADGTVWFTDPRYGARDDLEMSVEAVYRISPDGSVSRMLEQPDLQRPNGIALSPDGRTLYVVDSFPEPGGSRRIWAHSVDANGDLDDPRVLIDFGRARGGDGLKVDSAGRLYVCAGVIAPRSEGETAERPPGVYVFTPDGKLAEFIAVPLDLITNCCFGGREARTLYVTAGHTVFQTEVEIPGWLV